LCDRAGHKDGREDADEPDLEIGDPSKACGAGGGEFAVGDIAAGRVAEHCPEEDEDEHGEVGAADIEMFVSARGVLDQAHRDWVHWSES